MPGREGLSGATPSVAGVWEALDELAREIGGTERPDWLVTVLSALSEAELGPDPEKLPPNLVAFGEAVFMLGVVTGRKGWVIGQ